MKAKQRRRRDPTRDPLVLIVAGKMRGVLGEVQEAHDAALTGDYAADRAVCEAAIRQAQEELDAAGDGADKQANAYDLAWSWWRLDEAFTRLAHVESRARLARRRQALMADNRLPIKEAKRGR